MILLLGSFAVVSFVVTVVMNKTLKTKLDVCTRSRRAIAIEPGSVGIDRGSQAMAIVGPGAMSAIQRSGVQGGF
jgi:hypothetical protein